MTESPMTESPMTEFTPLVVIRHAATAWNAAGYMQGRRDIPLSDAGRADLASWTMPPECAAWRWVSSPLSRARATAAALHAGTVATDQRLLEFDWGEWEGPPGAVKRAAAKRAATRATNRGRGPDTNIRDGRGGRDGLDRRAPGGETMRDVQARVGPWLADIARTAQPTVAVTHKGVILAIYALATGWDLTTPSADTLGWRHGHKFALDPAGIPRIDQLNIAL